MRDHMKVPDGSILPNDPVIILVMARLADPLLDLFQERRPIVWMHSAPNRFQGYLRRWLQPENTETLLAHVNIAGRDAPGPAPRMAETLPLRQISFASAQRLLSLFPPGYVPVNSENLRRAAVNRYRRRDERD